MGDGLSGLQPYTGRWDKTLAAHLLNRAIFGALPEEIDRAAAAGLEKTVDALLAFQNEGEKFPPPEMPDSVDRPGLALAGLTPEERRRKVMEAQRAEREAVEAVRAWWVRRMRESRWPVREKLVLFWHGHFTSSVMDVKSARLMFNQNALFRKHCLGNFRTLLVEVSRDPAMLRYLDNNTNRKQSPNENYARELMELFSMGIGNYSEDDVKAAARAFTGWTARGDEFEFRARDHDDGAKTFLGETGNWDGTDVIDIILRQPCTAEFMAAKLLTFFACDNPGPTVVAAAATVLRQNKYEIKPLLRALFTSEFFYSAGVYRTQIKSPVQLVIGSARLIGVGLDDRALALAMRGLGQELLAPPNVKGWDGGETWINTTTLLMRYNLAGFLLSGEMPGLDGQRFRFRMDRYGKPTNQMDEWYAKDLAADAPRLVDALTGRLLQAKLDVKARQWLIEQAETTLVSERAVRIAHLLMSMPDYQLC